MSQQTTQEDRIKRLEDVLGTLIHWLHRELGTDTAKELLHKLREDIKK